MVDRVEDCNLFMMCARLERAALAGIPDGYAIRNCRPDELELWYRFPFDNEEDRRKYRSYMELYFENVYWEREAEFWDRCLFICDREDRPVGTCFAWRAYDSVTTIHWFKVRKELEGRGLGRALLSYVMGLISEGDYPVYLHTQPGSYRAIKLYSDFGFKFLTDEAVGYRSNDLRRALSYLREKMEPEAYARIKFTEAPPEFLAAVRSSETAQF